MGHAPATRGVVIGRIVGYCRARAGTVAIRDRPATAGQRDDPVAAPGTRIENDTTAMTEHAAPDGATPLTWTTDDGDVLILREIRADDADALLTFVRSLSFAARYFRYGRGDIEFTEEHVRRVCSPNPRECLHFVVVKRGEADEIVGSARIVFTADATDSELAITVTDAWQARRVGKRLIEALLRGARQRRITRIHAEILATNLAMIDFMGRCGFTIADSPKGPGLKIATIEVGAD